jgi:cytochrome P450
MTTLVDLGLRRGLARYRSDRLGLLTELGAAGCDLAVSRIGRLRLYLVTAAPLAHEVLVTRTADHVKSRAIRRFARPLLGDGLISADGEIHRRHRKLLAGGFQSRQVARYADDMVRLTSAMLAGWQAGEARDFAHDITMLTVRIAAKTMFGDAEVPADEVGAALDVANRWVMDQASSAVPIPLAVPTPRNRGMAGPLARHHAMEYDVNPPRAPAAAAATSCRPCSPPRTRTTAPASPIARCATRS